MVVTTRNLAAGALTSKHKPNHIDSIKIMSGFVKGGQNKESCSRGADSDIPIKLWVKV